MVVIMTAQREHSGVRDEQEYERKAGCAAVVSGP